MSEPKQINRREFIGTALTATAAFTILPRHVLGGPGYVPPSEKINLACIGVGSQGTRVMMDFLRQPEVQVISVCDVNRDSRDYCEWSRNELRNKVRELIGEPNWGKNLTGCRAGRAPAKEIVQKYYARQNQTQEFNGVSAYSDFRELLANEKDLDAVVVCTPDHTHAVISLRAMEAGKHVFCQKPLTNSLYAARQLAKVSVETGLATQVATGVTASESTRVLTEWIADGAIGPVREVHNWSARPFWPQGMLRPTDKERVPRSLDWDLWLGPAPERPYHPAYLPFIWRGWYDFGTGSIGDMGCYSFDTIARALKLGPPSKAEVSSSSMYHIDEYGIGSSVDNDESFPRAALVHLDFPARENMPPVTIHFYDGGLRPRVPDELTGEEEMPGEGLLFVGDDGKILSGFSGRNPRLIPKAKMDSYVQPAKTLPRSIGHYEEWLQACKGSSEQPGANFAFAGKVTEIFLTGNIALRAGKPIEWDSEKMMVTNVPEANAFIKPESRSGWQI